MRNYGGFGKSDPNREKKIGFSENERRVKVVVEDNTIYEIDLDCYECLEKAEPDSE